MREKVSKKKIIKNTEGERKKGIMGNSWAGTVIGFSEKTSFIIP